MEWGYPSPGAKNTLQTAAETTATRMQIYVHCIDPAAQISPEQITQSHLCSVKITVFFILSLV